MIKQTDAIIIFVVLAAVVGILMLSSNTASLVVIAALAIIFGGWIGIRLRSSRSTEQDSEITEAPADEQTSRWEDPVGATAQSESVFAQNTSGSLGADAMSSLATKTVAKPITTSEVDTPSQMTLLKNLVASVSEGITFKDPQGRYISANAAFARMFGSLPSEIVGRDDAGVFGHLTAQSLLVSDDAAAEKGRISTTLEVPLPDGPRYFEITKTSVSNDDDSLEGIVAVWRDVTELALSRLRGEKAMRETIMAFTKSIELRDPYLGDHAQRLAQLATAVSDAMELGGDVRTTVELAAYLSQIGKMGIDTQLLNQQHRYTEQETKAMQKHVHNTARLLRDLDFGLPVAATLFQMNERLDGSGYPRGVRSGDIATPARILGACDVFCARIAPRSYRPAIEPEAALDVLLQNPHRYDEAVVRAMQQVVRLPENVKVLA